MFVNGAVPWHKSLSDQRKLSGMQLAGSHGDDCVKNSAAGKSVIVTIAIDD